MTSIVTRPANVRRAMQLQEAGVHPLLARLFAARDIDSPTQTRDDLSNLLPPESMTNCLAAGVLLADTITAGKKLLIAGDYDCDGATAVALGVRVMRQMGAVVDYLLPDRFRLGYGLSPALVDLAAQREPGLIITVDNGIADVAGAKRAKQLGIPVLVTDHHLPGQQLPDVACIVNPNQSGCSFASKSIAGVGVMFYVLLALRAELRKRGVFNQQTQPNLASWLDLVALGTVADVVPLDHNNRILVNHGLRLIRQGKATPGLMALFKSSGRNQGSISSIDLGFIAAPRLNAAGRMKDMTLGVECLLCDNPVQALAMAQKLEEKNHERRERELSMREDAEQRLKGMDSRNVNVAGLALFDASWHLGIVGILAARLKDKLHRPVFAFAPGNDNYIKGSGRSIAGFHLRDALDLINKRAPGMLKLFGGHAAAAGVTIMLEDFERFAEMFHQVAAEQLGEEELTRILETDGYLEDAYYTLPIADMLRNVVWGQGFPPPLFNDTFQVSQQKLLQGKHLRLQLRRGATAFSAICFNHSRPVGDTVNATFRLEINSFRGVESLQLNVVHLEYE